MGAARAIALALVLALVAAGCDTAPPPPSDQTVQATGVLSPDVKYAAKLDLGRLAEQTGLSLTDEDGVSIELLDSRFAFDPFAGGQREEVRQFLDVLGLTSETEVRTTYLGVSLLAIYGNATPTDDPEATLYLGLPGSSTTDEATSAATAGFALAAPIAHDRLMDYLSDHVDRLETDTYNDTPIVRLGDADDGDDETRLYLGFLDDLLIGALSERGLQAMIDRHHGTLANLLDDEILHGLVREADHTSSAWVLARALTWDVDADDEWDRLAQLVTNAALAVDIQDEGRLQSRAAFSTTHDAGDVASIVRGALSALEFSGGSADAYRDLLDTIEVTDRDDRVVVTGAADMESLLRLSLEAAAAAD